MYAPFTYLRHVREEFSHIVWPTNRTAVAHTLVVVFIAVVMGILVTLFDYIFGFATSYFVG